MEARFERVFRRSDRDARQRIAYLYPDQTADALTDRYLAMFSGLATSLRRRGITMIVLKLPVPSY